MKMFWSDDPLMDFYRHERQIEEELSRLPKCNECGEPIQDDHCFEINGEFICEECLNDNHRKWTEDLMEN
jgi:formylmethanofuran dehydrogenase subunit E